MKIDVVTLFPKMFESPFAESMIRRAIDKKILELNLHDMRKWAWNDYGAVDDKPFGGDVGMLIRADVIFNALREIQNPSALRASPLDRGDLKRKIILTSARGKRFTQKKAEDWSRLDNLIIVCGHYEGFDQRVADCLADEEVSIGDYVLTGGELPAMVLVDSVVRLIPGVLGDKNSLIFESFQGNLLEYPQYTRPASFKDMQVPAVLLSGNHRKIESWRKQKSLDITKKKRPDLLG